MVMKVTIYGKSLYLCGEILSYCGIYGARAVSGSVGVKSMNVNGLRTNFKND